MEIELIQKGNEPRFPKLRTEQVKAAMRARFCQPEFALFFEVADGTGASQRRWADAVAMSMYNSRGLSITGFEIKVSRSDWKRELDNPAKMESVGGFCDFWNIVAPKGMIDPSELPPTWGLLEVDAELKMMQKVAAPRNQAVPPTKSFVASMLRSAAKEDELVNRVMVDAARNEWEKTVEDRIRRRTENIRTEGAEAIRTLEEFKSLSGVDLMSYKWDPEMLVKAIKLAESGLLDRWSGLERMIKSLDTSLEFAKNLKEVIDGKSQP